MQSRKFLVEIVCRQQALYEIEAPDAERAQRLAVDRWQAGEPSDVAGLEWCQLQGTRATEAPDPMRDRQDEELLLRFIRERERLLARLGGTFPTPSMNDALSAQQAAGDLGWYRSDPAGASVVDTIRAARALDRLCGAKKLICFERERVRAGERGTINLYCTPEYLERLTASMNGAVML